MIRSFQSRPLSTLWHRADASKIDANFVAILKRRLDALHAARKPDDMNVPGFNFHKLQGKPQRYTVHVNGPWCLTFEWDGDDAVRVDLEQYH